MRDAERVPDGVIPSNPDSARLGPMRGSVLNEAL
jgi:hypothetical protein